ncbi:GntR family transcriptional regulator [Streptomyces sp. NPDC051776]|uniref:GntR family transcriptional regulator n=1 Tax=Streptomyces sp. NPDC051776 TaxID=3155414 RepID=UPI0034127D72
MSLPSDDPRPPYLLAADKLRDEIASGRLKPGDRLPSSRALRDKLGIANNTVYRALDVLREEGLIYSVHGRGSYVSDPDAKPETDALAELAGEFTFDLTPPAWYTANVSEAAVSESQAPADKASSTTAAKGGEPSVKRARPTGETSLLTEILTTVRDQLRDMSAYIGELSQHVATLEAKVERLESREYDR